MNIKHLAPLLMTLAVSGCATTKDWTATGGSRADGVVRLSYEYGLFESPQTSEQQGVALAESRCAAWGYTDAQAFGGQTRQCNNYSSGSCNSWLVTREYQCIDDVSE